MKTLALLVLLAAPCFSAPEPLPPAPSSGTVEYSKVQLQAQDPQGALKDAEIAVARTGSAEAYAARADAKFALGRPIDDVIADYDKASRIDARYAEKYKGLIAQRDSERGRQVGTGGTRVRDGANGLAMTLAVTAIGCLLFVIFLVMVHGQDA